MLTLTFLGVGSAFAKRNFQSNALVEAWARGPDHQEAPEDTLLIDFGTTGPLALHALKQRPGFSYLDSRGSIRYGAIGRVFVSHLHADHVGGLEELASLRRYPVAASAGTARRKPRLAAAGDVLSDLWEHSLKGGLAPRSGGFATLEDYFAVEHLALPEHGGRDRFTLLDRYTFILFRTDHIRMHEKYDWPSYGLLVEDAGTKETVFYSSDTRLDREGAGPLMSEAKLIFHDVQLEPVDEPVHAPVAELRQLPEEVRRRMILFHYGDTWDSESFAFVEREFVGFARPQRRYVLFG